MIKKSKDPGLICFCYCEDKAQVVEKKVSIPVGLEIFATKTFVCEECGSYALTPKVRRELDEWGRKLSKKTGSSQKKVPISPRKNPKQTRSQILVDSVIVAMTRILEKVEFSESTTNNVAKIAGVSIGSLYQYFPNKESLVIAVIDYEVQRHLKAFEKRIHELQDETIEEIVKALVRFVIEAYLQRRTITRHLAGPILRLEQIKILELGRRKVALMIMNLLEARKAEIQVQDYYLAAYLIINSVLGVVEPLLFDKTTKEFDERLIQETQKMIFRYLGLEDSLQSHLSH